jgi:hypothetical protein
MFGNETGKPSIILIVATLAIAVGGLNPPADARQKKVLPSGGICTCQCSSDEKWTTLSGVRLSKWSTNVSFAEEDDSACWGNDGGGCRIKTPDGYVPGTMAKCSFNGSAELSGAGDQPPDVKGDDAPTDPRRTRPKHDTPLLNQ